MHETFRVLGREHELDLEREARKRHLAAAMRAEHGRAKPVERQRQKRALLVSRLLAALLGQAAER